MQLNIMRLFQHSMASARARFEIHISKIVKCQGRFDSIHSFLSDEQRYILKCIITM